MAQPPSTPNQPIQYRHLPEESTDKQSEHKSIINEEQKSLSASIGLESRRSESVDASEALSLQTTKPATPESIHTSKRKSKEISRPVNIDEIKILFRDVTMRERCTEVFSLAFLNCFHSCGTQTSASVWRDVMLKRLSEFNSNADEKWAKQQPDMVKIMQFSLFVLLLYYVRYNDTKYERITRAFDELANCLKVLMARCYLIANETTLLDVLSVKDMDSKAFSIFPGIGGTDDYTSIPKRLKKHLYQETRYTYPEFIFELRKAKEEIEKIKSSKETEEIKQKKIINQIEAIEEILELTKEERNYKHLIRVQLQHPTLFAQPTATSLEKVPELSGFKNLGNTCFIGVILNGTFTCLFPIIDKHPKLEEQQGAWPIARSPDKFHHIQKQLRELYLLFTGETTDRFQSLYQTLISDLIAEAKKTTNAFSGLECVKKEPLHDWQAKGLMQQDACEFLQSVLDEVLALHQDPRFSFIYWTERTIEKGNVSVKTTFRLDENRPSNILNINVPENSTYTLQELLDHTFKERPFSGLTTCTQADLDFTASSSKVDLSEVKLTDGNESDWSITSERQMLRADCKQLEVITLNFTVPHSYASKQQFKDALLKTPHRIVYLTVIDNETMRKQKLYFEVVSSVYYEQDISATETAEEASFARSGHYLAVIEHEWGGSLLYDNENVFRQREQRSYRIDGHFGRGVPCLMMLKRISEEAAHQRIVNDTLDAHNLLDEPESRESQEGIELQIMPSSTTVEFPLNTPLLQAEEIEAV
ncbi:hypothetical protein GCM10023116_35000 [Kistimonas scapharcae]|uniref:USP domain-containing protein n=1 Tax=Kistimonas scapharcae TaxID=1036133 RepID=A0ABP8V5Y9_9GAMM